MKKLACTLVIALLVAALAGPATAGKKKKKKKGPAPYTSPEATIQFGHVTAYNTLGTPASVTAQEFTAACAIPSSNGFDAYVYEVPEDYRAIEASIRSFGSGGSLGHDLDIYIYDETCSLLTAASTAAPDESGLLPKGSAYVLLQDYGLTYVDTGATVYYELEAL